MCKIRLSHVCLQHDTDILQALPAVLVVVDLLTVECNAMLKNNMTIVRIPASAQDHSQKYVEVCDTSNIAIYRSSCDDS